MLPEGLTPEQEACYRRLLAGMKQAMLIDIAKRKSQASHTQQEQIGSEPSLKDGLYHNSLRLVKGYGTADPEPGDGAGSVVTGGQEEQEHLEATLDVAQELEIQLWETLTGRLPEELVDLLYCHNSLVDHWLQLLFLTRPRGAQASGVRKLGIDLQEDVAEALRLLGGFRPADVAV